MKYTWYSPQKSEYPVCISQNILLLLQSHFERLSHAKLKKRKKLDSIPTHNLIQRHAGVLGLSAYVEAYPYDVPEFMPQILMDLSEHVNDPQPIQVFH